MFWTNNGRVSGNQLNNIRNKFVLRINLGKNSDTKN